MRTLRYTRTVSADLNGRLITEPVDLLSGNLSVRRYDRRIPLGKFAVIGDEDYVENIVLLSAAVITEWNTFSNEALSLGGALSETTPVYLDATDDMESTLNAAQEYGYTGVWLAIATDADRDEILASGLKLATNAGITTDHALRASLVTYDVSLNTMPIDTDINYNVLAEEAYKDILRFYYNSDPRHLPGEFETTVPDGPISIPDDTIVSTPDGIRFIVPSGDSVATGIGYVDLSAIPIDTFTRVEQYEINAHDATLSGIYVTNPDTIVQAHIVVLDSTLDPNTVRLQSLALGICQYATLYNVDYFDPRNGEPGVYMGENVLSVDLSNGYYNFTTDIGTVKIDQDWIQVNNILGSISHHTSNATNYRTAGLLTELATLPWIPIDHNSVLNRFVQFENDETVDAIITITDEGDTIPYDETDRMVDQLPLWMKWKDPGSTGYEMNNIIGRHIAEIFGAGGVLSAYHLEDLDDTINGTVDFWDVPSTYVPSIDDFTDDLMRPIPMASNSDELLFARIPCFYVEDGKLYIARISNYSINDLVGATNQRHDNLWTAFDEWGLLFGLTRHRTESVKRFRKRILDVFVSGFGSSKDGIRKAAIRELSPPVSDDFSNVATVTVRDLLDPNLKTSDGFQTNTLSTLVKEQRAIGVHTWGNAIAGKSIFDADGPDHIAQDRLSYAFDTPLEGNLLGGTGPADDIKIERGSVGAITPSILLKRTGVQTQTEYTGKRLAVTIAFKAKGTVKRAARLPVRYSVKVEMTIDGTIYHKTFTQMQTSNVNPNARSTHVGYHSTATHLYNILPYRKDGMLVLDGSWLNTSDIPAKPTIAALDTQVTKIVITNQSSPAASVRYWVEYADKTSHSYGKTPRTSNTLTIDGTHYQSALESKSGVFLHVQVAPFSIDTADGGTAATAVADYETEAKTKTIMLYDTMSFGDLVGSSIVVTRPTLTMPTYVTSTTYEATIIEVSPVDNAGHGESDPALISSAMMDDLKACTTIVADGNSLQYTVTFDPSKATQSSTFPYSRPVYVEVSSNRVIYIPNLVDGETRVINLKNTQIPQLPAGSIETSMIAIPSERGIIASLEGNDLSVSRSDDKNITALLAQRGYYWINGVEQYLYSDDTPASIQYTVAQGFTYGSRILPINPAAFSMVEMYVGAEKWTYQFYDSGDGTKTFTPDGLPSYNNSFYINENEIFFSEEISGPAVITVNLEPDNASGLVDTGITLSPFMSWENNFFVELTDGSTPVPSTITVSCDRPLVYNSRGVRGCKDVALISAIVLDEEGNPVQGSVITWESSSGYIIAAKTNITGADGRVSAYYSSDGTGEVTITATTDTEITGSLMILSIETSVGSAQTMSASLSSIVASGTDQVIDLVFSDGGSSYSASMYRISAAGTQNVEGVWPSAAIWTGTIIADSGRAKMTFRMTTEGLYKLKISPNMTLVWRVY